jgi:putative pyrroloquinoline-quinone binding quinoprotein
MKVECSCGAKYEFEVRPDMRDHPVKFVCPACGLDASEFVDGLVRRELGQSSMPTGVPIPVILNAQGGLAKSKALSLARDAASTKPVQLHAPQASTEEPIAGERAPLCLKHPGQIASERCYICSKPICPKCMELFGYACSPLCKAKADSHGVHIPIYEGQKSVVDARQWRKIVWVSTAAVAALAILLSLWFWYAWFGCAPKPIFSVRFAEPSYSGQSAIGGNHQDQVVFLHGATLARYDLKSGKEIWSRQTIDREQIQRAVDRQIQATKAIIDKANSEAWEQVPKMSSPEKLSQMMEREATAALTLHLRGRNIWVASPDKLVRYDWDTGKTLTELPVQGGFGGLVYRGNELLQVETDAGKTVVTHIDLVSGDTRKEELSGEDSKLIAQKTTNAVTASNSQSSRQEMAGLPTRATDSNAGRPIDPAKAAAQAQRLSLPEKLALPAVLAGNMNQQRALNELNDQTRPPAASRHTTNPESSFSLVPTKDGFVELSVKLLESRIVARSAMKAASGKPVLDGDVTAGKSMEMSNEMLNDMQRSNGGDVVEEDHSRYEVTLRQPGTAGVWTGEVIGPPKLYPLDSVNVLAADKLIIVLDKANKKLWQSSLNFNIVGWSGALDEESATYGQGPCVERKGSLYVFDEGVLSAFDLATGNARWRLPTVGIAGIFFDDRDMVYVNTTTASHDTLKYSRQIDLSRKVISVVLKLDSRNGKILWSTQSAGLVNYVFGKLVLTAQSYMPEERDDDNPVETGFEKGPWTRIRRINPNNGREVWDHFQERAPLDIAFDQNTIRLVFKKEVQVLRFPTF